MKPKFNIGDLVEAYPSSIGYEIEPGKLNPQVMRKTLIEKEPNKVRGVIIGAVYRHMGTLHIGSYYGEDPPCFTSEKAVLFWQIRQGYLNAPVEALESDIHLIERVYAGWMRLDKNKIPNKIPWKYVGEMYKENLSEAMKKEFKENPDAFPRDEKGRFV